MENKRTNISEIVHDLRNIMAVVKLYAQLGLQDQSAGKTLKEFLRIIADQANSANQLIEMTNLYYAGEDIDINSIGLHHPGDRKADENTSAIGGSDSRKRLEVLLSNLPGLAYRCRNAPGWPMEFMSEGCYQLTGYRPEAFIIEKMLQYEDIIHPDDRQYVNSTIQECISREEPFTLEYRIRTRTGEEKRVWEKGRQVSDKDDPARRLEGFIMDITERFTTEEALRKSQGKLMGIFRISPSGIGLVKNRILTEVNDRICEMTGYQADELIGKSSMVLYPTRKEFDFVGIEKYRQISQTGIGVVETRWKKKDGQLIDILLASTPLINDDEEAGIVFTALDITNLKQAEAEKKKMEEQLLQALKMETIGKLVGGVAHEFNNTLQIINTLTELSLLKLEKDNPVIPHLEQVMTSVRQSSSFVSQLLAFARKQPVNPEEIDPNEFISETMIIVRRLLGERIELEWIPGKPVWTIKIDPVQLNQVLMNLIINARDAISGDGKIIIETTVEVVTEPVPVEDQEFEPGEYEVIAIHDTGCGIDPEIRAKIFDPFFTTKPKGKGTGLGLSTVYGIVRQNNGFIIIDSKPGEGTSCRVFFPRHYS